MRKLLITTGAAYMIYFTQGFFFVLPGALTPVLSKHFGYSLSFIGYCFTLMMLARTTGNFFAGKLMADIKLHSFLLKTTGIIVAIFCVIFWIDNIWVFIGGTFICALALGAHFAISNNLILYLYRGKQRTAQISFMNSFYSIGAIVSPFILSFFLKNSIYWGWIMLATAGTVFTALLGLSADKNIFAAKAGSEQSPKPIIDKYVVLSAAAICLHIMGETIFSLWLPVFLMEKIQLSIPEAAISLVMLWCGFAAGRVAIGFIARYLASYKIIFILACVILASIIMSFNILTLATYQYIVVLLGLGLSGMFSLVLAFGNEQVGKPNARLMTLLTTASSVGGIVGLFLSSFIKSFAAADIIFLLAYVFSVVSTLCVAIAVLLRNYSGRIPSA